MIVPQNRLLWLIGCSLFPMALLAAVVPATLPLAWGTFACILVVSLLDALMLRNLIKGVRVEFPEQIHVTKNREGTLAFSVRDERGNIGGLRVALGLPREVTSSQDEFAVPVPLRGESAQVRWPITAWSRGEFKVTGCHVRVASRLGLWFAQGRLAADTRILVYPDLTREQSAVSALFLHRNRLGFRAQRQVGQGRDFEKLRDYLPGDSMSDIHWRITAKRGRLVTKEFQIERTQEIYVVVDASRLSSRIIEPVWDGKGSGREPVIERAISAALTLGSVALRQGDRFGLLSFNHRIVDFIRAAAGRTHFRVCRDALFDLDARTVTPDFGELATFILHSLRRRALLLLTSLDDPALAESFLNSMEPVSRRHLVLVAMVRPPSAKPVFSDGQVYASEDLYRHLGGHLLWQGLRDVERRLKRRGIGFSLVSHEKLCVEMVSQYMNIKRRQVL